MPNRPPLRELAVANVPIDTLKPYANNARTHSRAQLAKLEASIRHNGFTNPILTDEKGNILCGDGRWLAAGQAGLRCVSTIVLADMSEADRKAYILADNVIAQKAGWSKQPLAAELKGLADIGYDVELTGFDTLEIDTLLALDEPDGADDNVELPDDRTPPVSRLGDLWHIGEHSLYVGDAAFRKAMSACSAASVRSWS